MTDTSLPPPAGDDSDVGGKWGRRMVLVLGIVLLATAAGLSAWKVHLIPRNQVSARVWVGAGVGAHLNDHTIATPPDLPSVFNEGSGTPRKLIQQLLVPSMCPDVTEKTRNLQTGYLLLVVDDGDPVCLARHGHVSVAGLTIGLPNLGGVNATKDNGDNLQLSELTVTIEPTLWDTVTEFVVPILVAFGSGIVLACWLSWPRRRTNSQSLNSNAQG